MSGPGKAESHHPLIAEPATAADATAQQRTAIASIIAAALLVVMKLGAGLLTGSLGLVSAGIESSGDVVAAAVTFFAVRLGARPADPEHPYGHRRAENLSALAEATILLGGGVIVVVEAIGRLSSGGGSRGRTTSSTGLEPIMTPRWTASSITRRARSRRLFTVAADSLRTGSSPPAKSMRSSFARLYASNARRSASVRARRRARDAGR
jgi:hypothetical protein